LNYYLPSVRWSSEAIGGFKPPNQVQIMIFFNSEIKLNKNDWTFCFRGTVFLNFWFATHSVEHVVTCKRIIWVLKNIVLCVCVCVCGCVLVYREFGETTGPRGEKPRTPSGCSIRYQRDFAIPFLPPPFPPSLTERCGPSRRYVYLLM